MEVSNTQDIMDSRDVIERIEELEDDLGAWIENYMEEHDLEELKDDDVPETEDGFWEIKEELEPIKALAKEADGYAVDWDCGATLIRETYFTEYAEELCKDIGDLPSDLPWYIESHIDWDGVASDIKMDYTEVDFDGVAYLIR